MDVRASADRDIKVVIPAIIAVVFLVLVAVSYTHLDVYKRQCQNYAKTWPPKNGSSSLPSGRGVHMNLSNQDV